MRFKVAKAISKAVVMGGMALAIVFGMSGSTLQVEAATQTQLAEFREELKTIFLTGDSSVHDVEKYDMTYTESYSVWKDLVASDCKLAYNSGMLYTSTTKNASEKLKTYQVKGMEDDYLERYANVCKAVQEVKAGIDEDMTDLDKVLYIHEYLIDNVYYKSVGNVSHTAGGPLGQGYGVCQGYTKAIQLLLDEVGIENAFVTSSDMNHCWAYINLDGEWYHADACWDDTGKGSSSQYQHRYLLRNDDEFKNSSWKKHYNWYNPDTDETSTSTKFSDWFVHDVAGSMRYYEGFWYYQQGSSIMKAKIDGSQMSEVLQATGTVTLNSLENGVICYTVGGTTETFDLPKKAEDNASTEENQTQGENNNSTEEKQTEGENNNLTEENQTENEKIATLKLSGISKKIAAGKKIKLTPVVTPSDAANQKLKWTSSNKKYATVSSTGLVTTKKKGAGKTVTIKAITQDGSNLVASYKIKIVKHAVKSIKLKAKSKSVKAGKTVKVKAVIKTTGKTANKTLQWSSSNTKYATVTKKGVVKTKKAGKGKTVKITAKATDGTGKKATIKIKIK